MIHDAVEILLVEDDPRDIETTLRLLKTHHLANTVRVVRNGEEAIDFVFTNLATPPKVILLDSTLPNVNAWEVLRRIKSDELKRQIPVVVMSSSREESEVVQSYKLGANAYIFKPIDFEQFTGCVRDLGMYWLLLSEPPPESRTVMEAPGYEGAGVFSYT